MTSDGNGGDLPKPGHDSVLPCGRTFAEAWDGPGDGHSDDAGPCPYCDAVAEQRGLLDAASEAYAAEWRRSAEGSATSSRLPSDLLERVMSGISLELRPAVRLPIGSDGAGAWYVTDVAVGNALRLVLDGDPAVVMRRCRIDTADGGVRLWLSVAVSYDHYDRHGDDEVRARVTAAVADLFGIAVEGVDIEVVDVFSERTAIGRGTRS